jgi:homoserine trans-succinylase
MNKFQLKKLIQEIALQEIRVVLPSSRFKKIDEEKITYTSPSTNITIDGQSQDDNIFVEPSNPNPVIFGIMEYPEYPGYNEFYEMKEYLDQYKIPYNIDTYNDEDETETYLSVSMDDLEKKRLMQ